MNPRHMRDTLLKAESEDALAVQALSYRLLNDRCKSDAQAAVAALTEAPPFGALGQWRRTVAGRITEVEPELGLKLLYEWDITDYGQTTRTHSGIFTIEANTLAPA